ncbi:MAG: RloB family protein [Cyanobacteria bacterium J06621_8]
MQGSKRNQKRQKKKAYKDRNQTRGRRGKPNKRFLIVCEGTETEPNYFEALGRKIKNKVNLNIRREGKVYSSLVEKAREIVKEDGSYKINAGDEVWCVFDRDINRQNGNQQDFNEAIILAYDNSINLAISNDAFELWFLQHFSYYESETHRINYKSMLSQSIGGKYNKNDPQLYEKLEPYQEQAIKNSARLWNSYDQTIDLPTDETDKLIKKHNMNPSTTIHLLVGKLIKYL